MRFPIAQTIRVASHIWKMRRKGRERFPLVLMLEPLHACNLSCSGCGRIREYKDSIDKILSLDSCLHAVDEADAPVVSISGGEPLLYPSISELVSEILRRGRVVYLCTNGVLLGEKLHLFRPHKLFNINVHLDGLQNTHDTIVERRGVFERAVKNIALAKKNGFTVCTNTTVYKETDVGEIKELFEYLTRLGVDGMLISPGFSYEYVGDKTLFMERKEIQEKFLEILSFQRKYRIWSTPLFLEFCAGKRDYRCTPWGNVTYNIKGWKAPCYLITDRHYDSFDEFMHGVDWDYYSRRLDRRCANCMMHSGFEATAALQVGKSLKDLLRMSIWSIF